MDYAAAIKKVKAEKTRENFMVISIEASLVLPHKDGVALLQALANAEKLPRWSSTKAIEPLDRDSITTTPMSPQDYDRYKVAALLNVSYQDVLDAEKAAANPNATTPP
mgnify:CR=1 FL=1